MAHLNQQDPRSPNFSSSCLESAIQLLDHLENMRLCPNKRLPMPYLMRRINRILMEQLSLEPPGDTPRGMANSGEEEEGRHGKRQKALLHQTDTKFVANSSTSRQQPPAQQRTTSRRCSSRRSTKVHEGDEKKHTPCQCAVPSTPRGLGHQRGRGPSFIGGVEASPADQLKTATAPPKAVLDKFKEDLQEMNWHDGPLYMDLQFLWCEPRGVKERGVVLKEFAVTCRGTDVVAWITVRPPKGAVPRRRANDYAIGVLHSVEWENGDIDFYELHSAFNQLLNGGRIIYVKGLEKVNILVDLLEVERHLIVSLEELPRLGVLRQEFNRKACPYHMSFSDFTHCAMRHVTVLKSIHLEGRSSTSHIIESY